MHCSGPQALKWYVSCSVCRHVVHQRKKGDSISHVWSTMNVINEFHYTHDATKQTVKIVDELKTGK